MDCIIITRGVGCAPSRRPALDAALHSAGLIPDLDRRGLTQDAGSEELALQVTRSTKMLIGLAGGVSGGAAGIGGVVAALAEQPTSLVVTLGVAVIVIVIVTSMIIGLTVVTREDVKARAALAVVNLRMRADVTRMVMDSFDRAAEAPVSPDDDGDDIDLARLWVDIERLQKDAALYAKAHPDGIHPD